MMENVDPCRPMSRGFGSDGSNTRYSDNIEDVTRPINPEREREMAQIREQLEENQRLLKESEVGNVKESICYRISFKGDRNHGMIDSKKQKN